MIIFEVQPPALEELLHSCPIRRSSVPAANACSSGSICIHPFGAATVYTWRNSRQTWRQTKVTSIPKSFKVIAWRKPHHACGSKKKFFSASSASFKLNKNDLAKKNGHLEMFTSQPLTKVTQERPYSVPTGPPYSAIPSAMLWATLTFKCRMPALRIQRRTRWPGRLNHIAGVFSTKRGP